MRRRLTRILLLLALGVTIGWWLYRTPAGPASAHRALDRVVPVVRFRDAPLEQVLKECERCAGFPIEVQWESLEQRGVTRNTPVTLHRYGDTLRDVLRAVVRTAPH